MATYDDLAKQLNEAAQRKADYARELLTVAEEFTREVERVWQSGGKIWFGRLVDDTCVPGQISNLDDQQIAEFVVVVQFEVGLIPVTEKFPISIRKTRTSVQMSADPGNVHDVNVNQPASFHSVINDLQSVAYRWVRGEAQKSRL